MNTELGEAWVIGVPIAIMVKNFKTGSKYFFKTYFRF